MKMIRNQILDIKSGLILDIIYWDPFGWPNLAFKNHFLRNIIVGFVSSFFTLGYLGQIREDGLVNIWAEFQLSILFRSN